MHDATGKAPLMTLSGDRKTALKPPSEFILFGVAFLALVACFSKPLLDLFRLCWEDDFYSHIFLIPVVSAYLVWTKRLELPPPSKSASLIGIGGMVLAAVLLCVPVVLGFKDQLDILCFRITSFLLLAFSLLVATLGPQFAKTIAFPLGFLVFFIPPPPFIVSNLEIASQHASAEVYSWLLDLTRTPYYREGQTFALDGLNLVVAQECSGIRSSFVLFIVSLLAGYLFLQRSSSRWALALFVFPLGIARNAFRILVLSLLTIHWDARVIHSPLHHKGGPIFFVISLVPFALFLACLAYSERKRKSTTRSDSQ